MFRLSFLFIFLTLAGAGQAESFTPEAAVARALRQNPDLAAARLGIEEARGRLLHSGRLSSPEIEAEIKPNLAGREFSAGLGLVQKFPLSHRLRFEKAVSRAELAVAELEVREAERALGVEVRSLAVKLLALHAQRELKRAQILHGRELALVASRIAASGEGSSLSAAQLELEAEKIEIELLHLDAEEAALVGALRPMLGLAAAGGVAISGTLAEPSPVPGPAVPTGSGRADYLAAQARIEAARQNLELQRASKWEDVSIGISYEREHVDDAGAGMERDNVLGLKISFPLPLGKNNQSHVLEAGATAARREKEAAALADGIRAEAAAARGAMAAAAALHERISATLLPKSRQLEERFLAAYQSGQTALTDVLRSREQRISLEAARLDARRDFHLARIRFEAALGR
jgi:cobalt-zinc-cadmium efflux system outer membrane protein